MEINVAKITKYEGAVEKFEITDEVSHYDIDFCGEELKTISPISIKGTASNYEGKIEVNMSISTKVLRKCSRCLEDFLEDVNINSELVFVKDLKKGEDDYYLYKGETIDISDLVLGEIASELTMKPLCRDDCNGLCPLCGNNKNINACECKNEEISSKFQILSKLLEKEQGGV